MDAPINYKEWYAIDKDVPAYYEELLNAMPRDPQATARTRDAEGTMPQQARDKLFNISAEIKNYFHEFGSPMPPLMEGCTVLDLCCGSGRDTYLAAQLVGEGGKVIAVDPDAKKIAIAEKYFDLEMKQFGYSSANVEFHVGVPEDLQFIEDASVDIVVSNCTFNLSPNKEAYVEEVFRVLKDNAEWYFTDVFTDRRIPVAIAHDINNRAQRLGGAMYVGDFRRLVQSKGFNDPRYLINWKSPLSEEEQSIYEDVSFATLTVRAMKSLWSEDVCENYGETVTYDGSLPDYPDYFLFEHNIKFPTGKSCSVCGNVTTVAAYSRYAKVFKVEGNRETHLGDTCKTYDALVVKAPDFSGVRDEDDQPIQASCC